MLFFVRVRYMHALLIAHRAAAQSKQLLRPTGPNTVWTECGRLCWLFPIRTGEFDVLGHLLSFSFIVLVFAADARAGDNGAGRYNADGPYAATTAVLAVPSVNGAFAATAYVPKAQWPHLVVIFSSGFMQIVGGSTS